MSKASGAAVALAALAFAAPAGAATYTASVSPDPFTFAPSQQLVYRLHVSTGGQAERILVSAEGPEFPDSGPTFAYGGFFSRLDRMTLEGPGTVYSSNLSQAIVDRFCSPPFADTHGEASFLTPTIDVEIPANTMSTLVLPTRTYDAAPLAGMSLAVRFAIAGAPGGEPIVLSPSPRNAGRHGVPISFQTDPRGLQGSPGGCLGYPGTPVVPLGSDVLMSGRADPGLGGQLMTIRAARLGDTAIKQLATVRVGGDGAFGYRWRPTLAGEYALGALYRSQSPSLTDDFSAATTLRVAAPSGRARPDGITAIRRVRCRGTRCVILVRGAIKRPAGTAAGCSGKARLRVAVRRKRVLSARVPVRRTCRYRARQRFTLRSRTVRSVTVRVSYLGDAALLPRAGRAARVRIQR